MMGSRLAEKVREAVSGEGRRRYSGAFQVRLPPSLHQSVAQAAAKEGMSLNQYIVTVMAVATGWNGEDRPEGSGQEARMIRRAYGGNKRSYIVVTQPGDRIELLVCHDNRAVRGVLREHQHDPRYFLQHLSTYERGHFRAYYWLSEVIKDYRRYFEAGRVDVNLEADCTGME